MSRARGVGDLWAQSIATMQRKLLSWVPGKKEDSEDSERKKKPKSVGLFSGFFFNINYIVGTGFLSVPYGFYHAGTLMGTVTLLALSFVSWNAANWIIESMARSQVSWNPKNDYLLLHLLFFEGDN